MAVAAKFEGGKLVPLGSGEALTDVAGNPISGGAKATHRTLLATTGNIADLATGAPDTVDSVTVQVGDLILVKDQTTALQNGIYEVTTVGTGVNGVWARWSDMDESTELNATILVQVVSGTINGDTLWALDSIGGLTIGVSSINFVKESRERDRTAKSGRFYLDGVNQLTDAEFLRFVVDKAGYLTAFSVSVYDARTGGTLDLVLKKNGSALGVSTLDLQINNTDTQNDIATAVYNTTSLDVAASDVITAEVTSTAFTPLATCGDVTVIVEHQF